MGEDFSPWSGIARYEQERHDAERRVLAAIDSKRKLARVEERIEKALESGRLERWQWDALRFHERGYSYDEVRGKIRNGGYREKPGPAWPSRNSVIGGIKLATEIASEGEPLETFFDREKF